MRIGVAALIVGNVASKAVGLLREVLFAAWFGTGDTAAAYRIAQTAYLMPTHAFVGDALSAGLLPLYKAEQAKSQDRARMLVAVAVLYGLLFSGVATTLLFVYSSSLATFIAPGASDRALELACALLRVMALATPFYVLSGMLSYIETAYGRYGAIAWRPILLNIGSIAGAALTVWLQQDHWLATGLLISHVLFFLWTVRQIVRLDRLLPEARLARGAVWEITSRFLRNLAPLLGLPLAAQVTVLVERIVSSWIGTDVIPSVDYARFISDTAIQLIAVPLGILTMSVHGGNSADVMRGHVVLVTRGIMLIAFPTGVFIAMNASAIVQLLFARGAFDAQSVDTTSAIMAWMAAALGLNVTSYYLIKALNAQLRNREAFLFTVAASVVSISINLTLWPVFGSKVVGMAVAGYAATMCFFAVSALQLWQPLLRILVSLAIGLVLQASLHCIVKNEIGPGLARLAVSGVLTAILWLILVYVSQPLRLAARPILSKLTGLRFFVR